MKKLFTIVFIVSSIYAFSQNNKNCCETPFIRVQGIAEIEIVPDEIYLSITLNEEDDKQKTDILLLEEKLKETVHSLGIDMKNLMLQDASSNFDRGIWRKDVNKVKDYLLLVHSAEMVGKVLYRLDEVGISNVYIEKYTHSKIEEFRKEVKINAMKAAKEKASYLLEAIGEKAGSPLEVLEQQDFYPMPVANMAMRKTKQLSSFESNYAEIDFKKIKLQYTIDAKFEIIQ